MAVSLRDKFISNGKIQVKLGFRERKKKDNLRSRWIFFLALYIINTVAFSAYELQEVRQTFFPHSFIHLFISLVIYLLIIMDQALT